MSAVYSITHLSRKPDYRGGSIVNLMSSLGQGLGAESNVYPTSGMLPVHDVAEARSVVLLVLDGLGYHYLQQHRSAFDNYLTGSATSVFPTSTAPAVTTFMTGLAPQQHGVTGWFMYFKELATMGMILPFSERSSGASLARTGNGIADLVGAAPFTAGLPSGNHIVIGENLVDSDYTVTLTKGAKRAGYDCLDELTDQVVSLVEDKSSSRYIYAYWPVFDSLSHRFGVNSKQVEAHFYELAAAFDNLIDRLAGTDTLLVVTADHGFIDTSPDYTVLVQDHPELAECLTMPLCGEPRLLYAYVRANRTAQFERYVDRYLSDCCDLYRSEDLIRQGWFGLGEAHPQLIDRVGDYVLMPKPHWIFLDRLPGEKYLQTIGVHGGTTSEEMDVPLIIARC